MAMKLYCFGARGSLPAPSRREGHLLGEFNTIKYGGNTTNYYLEAGDFKIILDGGSGIRELGNYLMSQGTVTGNHFIHLISHYHSDHLQGLGFFAHYYIPGNVYHIHGFTPEGRESVKYLRDPVEKTISEQYEAPHFPVSIEAMPAAKNYCAHQSKFSESFWYHLDDEGHLEMSWGDPDFSIYDPKMAIKVTTIPLNHPNGCIGFRIEYMDDVFCFCTDNEPLAHPNKEITKHAKDADLILLDGQYTAEMLSETTQGFGHGQPEICVDQAIACDAKKLIIHHHDPNHDDVMIDAMAKECQDYFLELSNKGLAGNLKEVIFAQEGTIWDI
jgi:phosphoribosyl 1,2-cyclic phosphodiesterase